MSTPQKKLSVCLIARDEERFLRACLASLDGLADEIVLADTGSTDATVAIAKEFGATVVDHPWSDHFAEARNASLAAATGDYVLVIDPDEVLEPGGAEAIRAAIERGGWEIGVLSFVNIANGEPDEARGWSAPRLYQRVPTLRYVGRIHEQVTSDPPLTRMHAIAARVRHYGYEPEVWTERSKEERNRRLLERSLEDPEARDPLLRTNFLFHLALMCKGQELVDRLEEFESYVVARWPSDPPRVPWILSGRVEHVRVMHDMGRYEEAGRMARRLMERHGPSPMLKLISARSMIAQGLYEEARHELAEMLSSGFESGADHALYSADVSLIRARAEFLLGTLCEWSGDTVAAARHFEAAYREEPEQDMMLRAYLAVLVRLGEYGEANAVLDSSPALDGPEHPSLECLGLALALKTRSLGRAAFWGQRVRLAAERFPPAANLVDRLARLDPRKEFDLADFPELDQALQTVPEPRAVELPQTARRPKAAVAKEQVQT